MLEIPLELLKKTDKELHKILDKHPRSAKYYYDTRNTNNICEVKAKYANTLLLQDLETKDLTTRVITDPFLLPITFKDVVTYKQERLYSRLNTCSPELFIKYLNTVTSEVFPQERYDIIDNTENNGSIELIVHYPEIKITNSIELEHIMKDVYIKFTFSKNYICIHKNRYLSHISICRSTYFDFEVWRNYMFSHANAYSLDTFTDRICYGFTTFGDIIDNLKKNKISLQKFSHILLAFEEYLSWESIEGKPYKYIFQFKDTIEKYKIYNTDYPYTGTNYIYILSNLDNFKYNFLLKNGKYTIKLEQSTIDNIDELLTKRYPSECYYLINNQSYIDDNECVHEKIEKLQGMNTEIVFKGEIKKINIIETSTETTTIVPEKRIHRKLLNIIVNNIEEAFNRFIINQKLQENV